MNLIYTNKYASLCDYTFDEYNDKLLKNGLPPGIWHVDPTQIPYFFERIEHSRHMYTIVSPSCDFGICYQKYNHPAYDFEKWAGLQLNFKHGYNDAFMKARLNKERCNENDKYSIKCWSYTEATFDTIPTNVRKWFVSNCDIINDRVIALPFGINKPIEFEEFNTTQRNKMLYVNTQFYTTERFRLHKYYSTCDYATCVTGCSFEEFKKHLKEHKFVLCPCGNGLDSYRILETIYSGAIPIVKNNVALRLAYDIEYPMLFVDNMFNLFEGILEGYYEKHKDTKVNLEKVSWDYWVKRIKSYDDKNYQTRTIK